MKKNQRKYQRVNTWGLVSIVMAIITTIYYFEWGILHPMECVLILAPFYLLVGFIVHEATHYSAHQNRRVNNLIGFIGSFLMGGSFDIFKKAHHLHHRYEGQKGDPDYWVRLPFWRALLWVPFSTAHYYVVFPQLNRRAKIKTSLLSIALISLFLLDHSKMTIFWLLPGSLACSFFSFFFILFPHHPKTEEISKKWKRLTFYHHDHHRRPGIGLWQIWANGGLRD